MLASKGKQTSHDYSLAWEYSGYLVLLSRNVSIFKDCRQSFLGLVGLLAELILYAHFGERRVLHPSLRRLKQ